ncbi:MAG: hypothetical protein HC853_00320 [Anaerolineae bacterium]|nr:hypothetical protein [Anaerolineae bacterium]
MQIQAATALLSDSTTQTLWVTVQRAAEYSGYCEEYIRRWGEATSSPLD